MARVTAHLASGTVGALVPVAHRESTLTGTRLNQSFPLPPEHFLGGLLAVVGRNVRHVPDRGELALAPILCVPHLSVVRVRERDQARPTEAADHDDLGNHAHDIMRFDGLEPTARCLRDSLPREIKHALQRLRPRGATPLDLQARTLGANTVVMELDILSTVERSHTEINSISPTLSRVSDNVVNKLARGLCDLREVIYEGSLDTVSESGTTHERH